MQVNLEQAIALLKSGDVVAIPTETVYGLAADATNDDALRQIFSIKQRPMDNPLIVHIADISQVSDWAAEFSPLAQKLAKAFWPGPFTLVLPAKAHVSNIVRGGQPTVALRVPAHPLALRLLSQSGLALAAPSANKFTQLSPTTAVHVSTSLGEHVPVLDGGACEVGIESTIVAVQGENWQLLRLGMQPEASIRGLAGVPAVQFKQDIKAPGQHQLHYSPRTPIQLFNTRTELISFANKSQKTCAALLIGELIDKTEALPCAIIHLPKKATKVAAQLYASLHELDALNVQQLLVEMPPSDSEWLGILDRLTRAVG